MKGSYNEGKPLSERTISAGLWGPAGHLCWHWGTRKWWRRCPMGLWLPNESRSKLLRPFPPGTTKPVLWSLPTCKPLGLGPIGHWVLRNRREASKKIWIGLIQHSVCSENSQQVSWILSWFAQQVRSTWCVSSAPQTLVHSRERTRKGFLLPGGENRT